MRLLLNLPLVFVPSAAFAHPGHLTDLAGHDHWVAGAAIGIAIVLGGWAALKGKGKNDKSDSQDEVEDESSLPEPQES